MKPYLAILIDSFWEAVTSKVLWALLIGWSLLLASLAPFGYITESTYQLTRGDIRNRLGLAQKMANGLSSEGTPAQRAISEHLSPSFKKKLAAANADPTDRDERLGRISSRELVGQLNGLLQKPDLYDPEAFPTAERRMRIQPVINTPPEERTAADVELLNRELLQIAYSADLQTTRGERLWIGYAGLKLGEPLPVTRRQATTIIERYALQIIIQLGLSFITVFIGLIITSPMIPETFRSGSLHLLLSKPISRPLVYLTKFFGGTIFVLVNIVYLLTGLFLLVGWRLDIWNVGLLLCIPLLLFVFVIFYSVSALVGVIWNNPIISVVACIVFWVFCTVVGVLESSLRMAAQWTPQIVRFQQVEDEILAITQAGAVKVWNDKFDVWQPAAELHEGNTGRVLGPYYDAKRERLVMRSDFLDGTGDYATRSRNFVYADLSEAGEEESTAALEKEGAADASAANRSAADASASDPEENPATVDDADAVTDDDSNDSFSGSFYDESTPPKNADEARRKPRWPSENGIEPPMLMIDMLTLDGRTLAITRNGIFEIDWDAQEAAEAVKSTSGVFGNLGTLFNRFKPQPFKDLSPADYAFGDSVRVAATADQTRLYVYNSNRVDALKFDPTAYKFLVEHSIELDGDEQQSALIAVGSEHCVVARQQSPLVVLPRDLSEVTARVEIPEGIDVRQLEAIANTDRFSIVTHEGDWYELNGASKALTHIDCPWQGSITGVTWMSEEQVWIGIQPHRAVLWNAQSGVVERSLDPAMSRLDIFYYWIARPLYLVNPKPSSLNGVLQKLLSKEPAGQTQILNNDLAAARVEIEVWQPLISNLIFVAVLLAIGCVYVTRREF